MNRREILVRGSMKQDEKLPVLVDFYATWCGPCQMISPVLDDISKEPEFNDRLKFGKVSTEDHPELAEEHNVQGIPCLIIFKNGKEMTRIVGFLIQFTVSLVVSFYAGQSSLWLWRLPAHILMNQCARSA